MSNNVYTYRAFESSFEAGNWIVIVSCNGELIETGNASSENEAYMLGEEMIYKAISLEESTFRIVGNDLADSLDMAIYMNNGVRVGTSYDPYPGAAELVKAIEDYAVNSVLIGTHYFTFQGKSYRLERDDNYYPGKR